MYGELTFIQLYGVILIISSVPADRSLSNMGWLAATRRRLTSMILQLNNSPLFTKSLYRPITMYQLLLTSGSIRNMVWATTTIADGSLKVCYDCNVQLNLSIIHNPDINETAFGCFVTDKTWSNCTVPALNGSACCRFKFFNSVATQMDHRTVLLLVEQWSPQSPTCGPCYPFLENADAHSSGNTECTGLNKFKPQLCLSASRIQPTSFITRLFQAACRLSSCDSKDKQPLSDNLPFKEYRSDPQDHTFRSSFFSFFLY